MKTSLEQSEVIKRRQDSFLEKRTKWLALNWMHSYGCGCQTAALGTTGTHSSPAIPHPTGHDAGKSSGCSTEVSPLSHCPDADAGPIFSSHLGTYSRTHSCATLHTADVDSSGGSIPFEGTFKLLCPMLKKWLNHWTVDWEEEEWRKQSHLLACFWVCHWNKQINKFMWHLKFGVVFILLFFRDIAFLLSRQL